MSETIKALYIAASGECRILDLPREGGLTERQALVEGYIEAVYGDDPSEGPEPWHVWINEEGKIKWGAEEYNGLATDLLRHRLMYRDAIIGPAVVVGTGIDGNDDDVPESIIKRVLRFPDSVWPCFERECSCVCHRRRGAACDAKSCGTYLASEEVNQ